MQLMIKSKSRLPEKIDKKELTHENANELLKGRQWVINVLEIGIFLSCGVNLNDDYAH